MNPKIYQSIQSVDARMKPSKYLNNPENTILEETTMKTTNAGFTLNESIRKNNVKNIEI